MNNTGPTYSKRGNSATTPVKTGVILLGTFLLVVGLTVTVTGGAVATTATTATAAADGEELVVTTDCEPENESVNNLTVENPTAESVALTLSWNTSDRTSIRVQTETETDAGTQTTTHVQSQDDAQTQQIRILTQDQARMQLSTETS